MLLKIYTENQKALDLFLSDGRFEMQQFPFCFGEDITAGSELLDPEHFLMQKVHKFSRIYSHSDKCLIEA